MSNNSYRQKKEKIKNFYRYSDLSVAVIAKQLHIPLAEVQSIINQMVESDALELATEKSTTHVAKIMTPNVITLDYSKTAPATCSTVYRLLNQLLQDVALINWRYIRNI